MRLSIIILKNYGEASADNVLEISIILQTIIMLYYSFKIICILKTS